LNVLGCINITIRIGGTDVSQEFLVISDLNRNLILGLDFMKANKARIYFDLKCMRLNDKIYVNLEEDIHISSTVRIKRTCTLKPKTAKICYGKVRYSPDLPTNQSYEVKQIERGFIVNEPGLQVINSVSTLKRDRSIAMLIVN